MPSPNLLHNLFLFGLLVCLFSTTSVKADDDDIERTPAYDKAHLAVSNILFDYEEPGYTFASFRVNENGFVDILFASNMPDALYGEILTRLQQHPDISGVLASQGGPACKLW